MRLWLTFLLALISIPLYAASPSFQAFNTNDFTATGQGIGSVRVSTNLSMPSGQGSTAVTNKVKDMFDWQMNIPPSLGASYQVPPLIIFNTWPLGLQGSATWETEFKRRILAIRTNGLGNGFVLAVQIDDGWGYDIDSTNALRTANGTVRVDTNRWPSCTDDVGFAPITEFCWSNNVIPIIYAEIQGPSSVGDMVTLTNHVHDAHTLARWGFGGVKIQNRAGVNSDAQTRLFIESLHTNGVMFTRLLNDSHLVTRLNQFGGGYSPWGQATVNAQYVYDGTGDPQGTFASIMGFWHATTNYWGHISPSHFLDPAWTSLTASNALSTNEARVAVASRMAVPLLYEVANPYVDDAWRQPFKKYQETIWEPEALRIYQDPLVRRAYRVYGTTNHFINQPIIRRELIPVNGLNQQSVLFINAYDTNTVMTATLLQLGYGVLTNADINNIYSGTNIVTAYEIFEKTTEYFTNQITVTVGGHGCKWWRITPGYHPPALQTWYVAAGSTFQTNSVATKFNDPVLRISNLPSNHTYQIEFQMTLTSGVASTDGFRFSVVVPTVDATAQVADLNINWRNHNIAGPAVSPIGITYKHGAWNTDGTTGDNGASNANNSQYTIFGDVIVRTSASGDTYLKWCQFTSTTNTLTRSAGSIMKVTQLD